MGYVGACLGARVLRPVPPLASLGTPLACRTLRHAHRGVCAPLTTDSGSILGQSGSILANSGQIWLPVWLNLAG